MLFNFYTMQIKSVFFCYFLSLLYAFKVAKRIFYLSIALTEYSVVFQIIYLFFIIRLLNNQKLFKKFFILYLLII